MKVLVVGSGGREHSIIWNLSKDKKVKEIICIGDNAGISKIAKLININIEDLFLLEKTIKDQNPDLVVIGPEGPLSKGITDLLIKNNINVFGPTKQASQIEASKIFAKRLMLDNDIPTPHA